MIAIVKVTSIKQEISENPKKMSQHCWIEELKEILVFFKYPLKNVCFVIEKLFFSLELTKHSFLSVKSRISRSLLFINPPNMNGTILKPANLEGAIDIFNGDIRLSLESLTSGGLNYALVNAKPT